MGAKLAPVFSTRTGLLDAELLAAILAGSVDAPRKINVVVEFDVAIGAQQLESFGVLDDLVEIDATAAVSSIDGVMEMQGSRTSLVPAFLATSAELTD
jgi:hypothetical protein